MTEDSFYTKLKRQKGEIPELPQYETVSPTLRNQFYHIVEGADILESVGARVVAYLREEFGVKNLYAPKVLTYTPSWSYELELFLEKASDNDQVLAAMEIFGRILSKNKSRLENLNMRMRNAGLGFRHTGETLIRIDDESFYENATLPALGILSKKGYLATREGYLKAYAHLKEGHYEDAVTSAVRSLETLLKTRLGVDDGKKMVLSDLVDMLKKKAKSPLGALNMQFKNIIELVNGVAGVRNQEGAHGKTETASKIDEYFVRYIINQVAASILFVAEVELIEEPAK